MEFSYLVKHFKFLTLPHGASEVANVFVHGYSAGHDLRDRRLLSKQIPSTLHSGINILGFWRSGHFMQMSNASRQLIAGASRVHPYFAVAAFAAERVAHFARSRRRAVEMGEVLLSELDDYLLARHPYVTEINLIGHSLGGRVLVSALRKLARQPGGCSLTIGDVLLMAAAVEVGAEEARGLKACINGRLINAFSRNDRILLMNADEKCLGRHEVANFDNVEMDGFGHQDYWPKLHKVLASTGFAGFQGQHYPAPMGKEVASQEDHVRDDYLLYDLFEQVEQSQPALLGEAIKHLKTSSWTDLDDNESDRLYAFTREFQLLGGHCLANMTRRRGLPYAEVLEMLVAHFELGDDLHDCATILELEAALVRTFFSNAFADGHVLCHSPEKVLETLSAEHYFKHVDALAERLTLTSYFKSPTSDGGAQVAGRVSTAMTMGSIADAASFNVLSMVPKLLGNSVGRVITNFKTALKPGYSALIPAVAIIFYARVKLGNSGLH